MPKKKTSIRLIPATITNSEDFFNLIRRTTEVYGPGPKGVIVGLSTKARRLPAKTRKAS